MGDRGDIVIGRQERHSDGRQGDRRDTVIGETGRQERHSDGTQERHSDGRQERHSDGRQERHSDRETGETQ